MQAILLAIAIIAVLLIGKSCLPLRKSEAEQNRWAWWKEFHQRVRRYPTPQEVDNWTSEQTGPSAP